MSQSEHDEKIVSRRTVIKGGAASVAGAFATFLAARSGSAAVTGMDRHSTTETTKKKDSGKTIRPNAVTPMDVR